MELDLRTAGATPKAGDNPATPQIYYTLGVDDDNKSSNNEYHFPSELLFRNS